MFTTKYRLMEGEPETTGGADIEPELDTAIEPQASEAPADPSTEPSAEPSFPGDWREKYANGDEDILNRLQRYNTPNDALDALIASQNKIRSGMVKEVTEFPADGSDEEKAAWREANNIPVQPSDYDLAFDDGLVIGEQDKEIVDAFVEKMHGLNASPETVKEGIKWYYDTMAEQEAKLQESDAELAEKVTDQLHKEWGNDYRANFNAVHGLLDTAPEGIKEMILSSRTPDKTPLGSTPEFIEWLSSLSRQINPVSTLIPNAGADFAGAVEDRIAQIDKMMREDRKAYNNDPKIQQEYRDLLDARDKAKKTA